MLADIGSFLITAFADFYLIILLLRLVLQWLNADYYNPISQFVVKLTDPIVKPARKIIPNLAGIDCAAIALLLVIAVLANGLLVWLQYQIMPYIIGLTLYAVIYLLNLAVNLLFYAVLGRVILSWLSPRTYNPAITIIILITEPLLAPIRRKLPPITGIDLSSLLLLLVLQMLNLFVIGRLLIVAKGLAIVG